MKLSEILAELPVTEAPRVASALALMRRQALASARLQGRVEALLKEDSSPVTVVDLLHQTQVQQLLRREFPVDALLCEEPRSLQERVLGEAVALSREEYGIELEAEIAELPSAGERVWILDPIDGTKGFVAGRYFAIALGYFLGSAPYFGAMAVPASGSTDALAIDRSLAFSVSGVGAYVCGLDDPDEGGWEVLRLKESSQAGPIRVAVSLAHGGPLSDRVRGSSELEVVALDSQAKYLAVATGEIDAYVRAARDDGQSDVIWDHMPGALVAAGAGCTVHHFDGDDVTFVAAETVAFRGGVVCSRDRVDGSVSRALRGLVAPSGA